MSVIFRVQAADFFAKWEQKNPMRLMMDALDDIGEEIYDLSRELAPLGETGKLKAEGMGFDHAKPTGPNVVRGAVGLQRIPKYGIWVHEGTGIFGHFRRPISSPRGNMMRFRNSEGNLIFRWTVKGQMPQPFLREATLAIEHTYAPMRVEQLAASLAS